MLFCIYFEEQNNLVVVIGENRGLIFFTKCCSCFFNCLQVWSYHGFFSLVVLDVFRDVASHDLATELLKANVH